MWQEKAYLAEIWQKSCNLVGIWKKNGYLVGIWQEKGYLVGIWQTFLPEDASSSKNLRTGGTNGKDLNNVLLYRTLLC